MTSSRAKLQEDTHFRLLHLLQEAPEMSHREPAAAFGVCVGSIHCVLNTMIRKGLMKLGNFTAIDNWRRCPYVPTSRGSVEKTDITRAFLARRLAEYETLKAEIDDLESEIDANARASRVGHSEFALSGI